MKKPQQEKWTIEKWIVQRRAELTARAGAGGQRAKLFLVPNPQRVEQLDLDFDADHQLEIEREISEVLERTQNRRKPKVS
jgi:hypothetical protein